MAKTNDQPYAHTIEGAAKVAKIGRSKLYELIRAGKLQARKCGRRTIILDAELRRLLESLPLLGAVPLAVLDWPTPRSWQWALLGLAAVFGTLSHFMLTEANRARPCIPDGANGIDFTSLGSHEAHRAQNVDGAAPPVNPDNGDSLAADPYADKICASCNQGGTADNQLLDAYLGNDRFMMHRACAYAWAERHHGRSGEVRP